MTLQGVVFIKALSDSERFFKQQKKFSTYQTENNVIKDRTKGLKIHKLLSFVLYFTFIK